MKIQLRQPSAENPVQNFYVRNEKSDALEVYTKYIKPFLTEESSVFGNEKENFVLKTEAAEISFRETEEEMSFQILELISDFWETSAAIGKVIQEDRNNPEKTGEVLAEELDQRLDVIEVPQDSGYTFAQLLVEEPFSL